MLVDAGGTKMRVGVVGGAAPDEFAAHIADALRQLGHEPAAFELTVPRRRRDQAVLAARQLLPRLDERAQQRISRAVLAAGCELVINIDLRLAPRVVAQLRAHGVKVAFWFPDAVSNLGRQLMVLAPYNALFFKDPHMVRHLSAFLATPVHYLPEACNPRVHRPAGNVAAEPYLAVVGNMYPSRVRLLERLAAKGIPLALFGAGFPRWLGPTPLAPLHRGRPVFGAEKARVFRTAAGVLNTLHPAEVDGMNARLFEAAGSGGAVLTEFRSALPALFAPEQEVLAFTDFDELVGQAQRLLGDAGLAARLGDAAARRAHRDHSYERRVAALLDQVA
jgi:spore maturation protein CgeB